MEDPGSGLTEQHCENSSNNKDHETNTSWLTLRKQVTHLVYAYALIYGCEYSAIVLTLYFYLERSVKTDSINVYFSLCMGAMAAMASVSGVLFGRYVDKTRKIRRLVLWCVPVTVVGNLSYTLHFSAWFVVVGRLLCGLGEAVNSALTGMGIKPIRVCIFVKCSCLTSNYLFYSEMKRANKNFPQTFERDTQRVFSSNKMYLRMK